MGFFNWLGAELARHGTVLPGTRLLPVNVMERVMSHKQSKSRSSRQPMHNDLRDWAAIGLIVVSSSLLVWGPLIIG
jgi:hypothetical protein